MSNHIKTDVEDEPFPCDKCHETFTLKSYLLKHLLSHPSDDNKRNDNTHSCDKCNMTFSEKIHLKKHKRVHHSSKQQSNFQKPDSSRHQIIKSITNDHIGTNKQIKSTINDCWITDKQIKDTDVVLCLEVSKDSNSLEPGIIELNVDDAEYFRSRVVTNSPKTSLESEDKTYSCVTSKHSDFENHKRNFTDERPFQCEKCSTAFSRAENLKKHMLTHVDKNKWPYLCEKCLKPFNEIVSFRRHLWFHSDPKLCNYCGKSFPSKTAMWRHKEIHPALPRHGKYKCPKCEFSTHVSERLQKHTLTHKELHTCDHCNKTFVLKSYLLRHMWIHNQIRPHICSFCSKTFKLRQSLSNHVETIHQGIRPYSCSFCDKAFSTSSSRRVHETTHTGEKRYECMHCGEAFVYSSSMRSHIIRKHTKEFRYPCAICLMEFLHPSNLEDHIQKKHPESYDRYKEGSLLTDADTVQKHKCNECHYVASDLQDLQNHQLFHNRPTKPYKCKECPKSFDRKKNLNSHKLLHIEEDKRPYPCGKCHKRFIVLNAFRRHLLGHSDPMLCDECGKFFTTKADVEKHKENHPPVERDYQYKCPKCIFSTYSFDLLEEHASYHKKIIPCPECDLTFVGKYNLKVHMTVHTGEKPYACSHCDKKFPQKYSLNRHVKRIHNKTMVDIATSEKINM